MVTNSPLFKIYLNLLFKYGPGEKYWPEWCANQKSIALREAIALGAILTQRTSWRNADLALKNLQSRNLLSLSAIANLPDLKLLTTLIKPAGFWQTKPKRLKTFADFITDNYHNINRFRQEKVDLAREKLLLLYGLGSETTDTILLYALDKTTFIIDEYTRRWVTQNGLTNETNYSKLQEYFIQQLPKDINVYQNLHVFIILDQKGVAHTIMPRLLDNYPKIKSGAGIN